jgi:hypothetical protein
MKSKLLRNWEAKLIALALATVIWFLVKDYLDRRGSARPASQGPQEIRRSAP